MTNRPTMLIVAFSPLVGDARVLKQIAEFSAGFDITTLGYGPAPAGVEEHLELDEANPAWKFSKTLVLAKRFRSAYAQSPAMSQARGLVAGRKFSVAIANDVEAAGITAATILDHGFHADLHEYSPKLHEEDWKFRWFLAPFYSWMTRTFVTQARSWSTVSRGLAREYKRKFGFDAALVTNAAPFVDTKPRPSATPLRLVHSGAGLRNRSLEISIQGVIAAKNGVTFDLFLTPNDPAYIEELRDLAARSHGRVRVNDAVPYRELAKTLQNFDLGLFVLPPVNFGYRWALPNKVFDFVQARLGIVSGPSPEIADFVTRNNVGVVTPDFSAESLTKTLESLHPEAVDGWKTASDRVAHAESSEVQSKRWVDAIARLMASKV